MTQRIDPWGAAQVVIDEKMIQQFGLKKMTPDVIPCDHRFFRRNIIIAHRDFDKITECIKSKKPFCQLTGIASSGPLHFGHKVDIDAFLLFKELGAKSRFVVSDIDAYVSRPDTKVPSMKVAKDTAVELIAHLLALGLTEDEIYVQSQKEPRYYEFAFEVSKKMTENAYKAIYGHMTLGKISANLLQYSDILHLQLKEYFGPMHSITGIGIEQDPHARACRDLAKKLEYKMKAPSFFYFKHQSGLQEGSKMSASQPNTAIFLSDSVKDATKKINKAFSGGKETVEEHRKYGGNPDIDKAYEMLFFHHPDDEYLKELYAKYKSGELLSGEMKKACITFVTSFLEQHQQKVTSFLPIAKKMVYK